MISDNPAGSSDTPSIIANLDAVARERQARRADPALAARAQVVREFQAARFRQTYADLLAQPATRAACEFFLSELYGVQDFMDRDAQFRRIVPAMARLFPGEVVQTVAKLAQLHALSEHLDTAMARAVQGPAPLDAQRYRDAWRTVGDRPGRLQQIDLVHQVGLALVRYTTHPKLGSALRMMRLPARAAGLSALQSFLERGFNTFAGLQDPKAFLNTIHRRESDLADELFGPSPPPCAGPQET